MDKNSKKAIVGITGGIAAYKTCELIRQLVKSGIEVKAVMTPAAKEFITETTIRTLTQNNVYCEQFEVEQWKPEHISLADKSDIMVIAPASANTIGKIASGICDNLLTSIIMAFDKPVVLAPAMNCKMWENKFLKENIKKLQESGFYFVWPEIGDLACGYQGSGKMADPLTIKEKVIEVLNSKKLLKGKKLLVTAGGTKEPLDPVRYIGNKSSGKMGMAIADTAFEMGANVTLISTVPTNKPYKVIYTQSAFEMLDLTKKYFLDVDTLIMTAAVADFRPLIQAEHKIKKGNQEKINIELVKNPDILKEIAKIKNPGQTIIGFCAESENLIQNALKKLTEKRVDFIVANDILNLEIGFNSDYNSVSIINAKGDISEVPKTTKKELARIILEKIFITGP